MFVTFFISQPLYWNAYLTMKTSKGNLWEWGLTSTCMYLLTNLFLIIIWPKYLQCKKFWFPIFQVSFKFLYLYISTRFCKPFLSMNWRNKIGTFVHSFICDFGNLLSLLLIRRFSPKADPTTNFLLSYWLAAGHLGIRWLEKRPFIKYVSCTSALFSLFFAPPSPVSAVCHNFFLNF